ncbi:MAG: 50S ribosomal protein L28 [Cutibacterium acnes]|nr:MAG: 50S ribosomal protein L28 [Cutibacterium acnes]
MSAICQVTGRKPEFGKQGRRYYLPSEGRTITLNVSTKGMKIIDRDGIESVVAKIRARGEKI